MPSNLYGVSNCTVPSNTVGLLQGADTSLPANTNTTIMQAAAYAAPTQGNFYITCDCYFTITLGATPPTSVVFGLQINGGSTADSFQPYTGLLVANATLSTSTRLITSPSSVVWYPGPANVVIWCNPAAQAVTIRYIPFRCVVTLVRG